MLRVKRTMLRNAVVAAAFSLAVHAVPVSAVDAEAAFPTRPISELKPLATIHVGKTADWVALTPDAVWVGSTGPDAVHRIDPRTNKRVATVKLPGEPCAGLATGFGSLWVPLCSNPATLAKVDLKLNVLSTVLKVGPAGPEGGIATSPDSIWLVVDKNGSLARIDPDNGSVRQTIQIPPGSFNPFYLDGQVWVTRADGAEVTSVDAHSGEVLGTVKTGPNPRFLSAGAGTVWTLNQGDGSLTRIDAKARRAIQTIALSTPGHGGDISVGGGMVWTTMMKVPLSAVDSTDSVLRCQWAGAGGDSLGIGHGAIWLTDYHGGTLSRLELENALARCRNSGP
ncbi:MAG: PQQ-binding-like beta-propeller repeat protein [Proteobacteria bacterium]|nr:PQQ-binding-like beta-propeller repeat protein [Pseudomonadota bacterium]